ncbi:ATP-dependent DNA helicase RecG [Desulfosporosinus acidiphilus SJ4]|uniref:ATP-dependent DNA helicase RecG n=1 Tax=Desulfosporosinus acidiphilus (strain DSM 22704 / JCM 16185 / SJ4) TaxID=646529 RepID=I4D9S5_DESAJ|nr:ATP-dependent DNA helicase RecG [Desulfosporosinus acidiphilus]AFM42549.1 ATP-dependent DNA helicase RecG [Desulfosporosinus acidiphilus SJ4]
MNFTQIQLVLNNLQRALIAEEKQGFLNTGVLGGFSSFLRGILSRLEQLFPGYDMALLRELAQNYSAWSPLRRREAFSELKRFRQEILLEAENRFQQGQNFEDIPETKDRVINKEKPESSERSGRLERPEREGRSERLELPGKPERSESQEAWGEDFFQGAPARKIDKVVHKPAQLHNHVKSDHREAKSSKRNEGEKTLQFLKGVGPERAKQLEKLGIQNVFDLLLYYPRRYEDRRKRLISELKDGESATLSGKVAAGQIIRGRLKVVKLSIEQQGRLIQAIWFNQTFILKQYPVGSRVIVTGKVRWQQQVPELLVTDIEMEKVGESTDSSAVPRSPAILPVYSETARLSSKAIRSIIKNVMNEVEKNFPEIIPESELNGWMERPIAHREIHFPADYARLTRARDRLVWEEVLLLQLAFAGLRQGLVRLGSPPLLGGEKEIQSFYKSLPFQLTGAQQRVIQEIFQDMAKPQGMARLVQGDVGSGKTAVAMAALLRAVGSGYQGAMMAPTEILAVQHFQALEKVFTPLGITVVCLLGSQSKSEREGVLAGIAEGSAQVIVGTHALIQESVVFKALGLAITDEQHRFGVRQRSMLQGKGDSPHVLVLTATPIPRTLALTLYGDLQLSVLDEMPAGRKPIVTRKLTERSRPKLEKFLEEQVNLGRQIYVVCPLVEESETLDLISATQRASEFQARFSHCRVALLHGKMKGSEKDSIMAEFQAGDIDILVATTVVEVGVNVPNASVMVIESAERFGLAQLHQLRGRVGRGSEQSYCFLLSEQTHSRRLDILCQTEDGFKIAEEDMRLRGTGELLGTRQHGLGQLHLADLSRDGQLVEKAYQMAQKALREPKKYPLLFQEVQKMFPPDKIGVH